MADAIRYPGRDDQIAAGPGGATLYYFENSKYYPWKWDGIPVTLAPGDQFHTTGEHSPVAALGGEVVEIYYYRRLGSKDIFPSESDARGGFLNGVGNFFQFSPDKIVRETKLVKWSEVTPIFNTENAGKDADTGSEFSEAKLNRAAIEKQLQEQVYDLLPSVPHHSQLYPNDGKWYVVWPNGWQAELNYFLSLPSTTKITNTTADLRGNATDPGKNNNGGKGGGTITIPAYLYWVLGSIFGVSLLVLVSQKFKRKQ